MTEPGKEKEQNDQVFKELSLPGKPTGRCMLRMVPTHHTFGATNTPAKLSDQETLTSECPVSQESCSLSS